MAEQPPINSNPGEGNGEHLVFRCSNCGYEGAEGKWFSVSQHIKMKDECRSANAKVLTLTLDKDGNEVRPSTSSPMSVKPEVTKLTPAGVPQRTMAEDFAATIYPPVRRLDADEDEDEDNLEEVFDPDAEYASNVKRVSIGRTAVPELPAWVIATYEAFVASGYRYNLSRFLEEAIALDLIFTGVNVQILPYSAEERQQVMERVGAIAQEVA